METGEIPEEMRKAFNISPEQTVESMFEELASEAGITKKGTILFLFRCINGPKPKELH